MPVPGIRDWPPAPIRRSAAVPAAPAATVAKPTPHPAVRTAPSAPARRQQYAPTLTPEAAHCLTQARLPAGLRPHPALEHKPPPVAAATGRAPRESAQRMRTKNLERLRSQSAGLPGSIKPGGQRFADRATAPASSQHQKSAGRPAPAPRPVSCWPHPQSGCRAHSAPDSTLRSAPSPP